jgi:hypothetical protein
MKRGFLTIAYGRASYLRMATGLARSMKFHNPAVSLALVTDSADSALKKLFDFIIPLDLKLGSGVTQKLHVDRYTPYDETLFVDSDCLAFADPELLWELYKESKGFGVKGWTYAGAGDTHYAVENMERLLTACAIDRLGVFNSGLFYFDRSPEAQRVFTTARKLAGKARELGLNAFKDAPCADEPVFALALAITSVPMLPWDGGVAMCTATADDIQGLEAINVFSGQRRLIRYQTLTEPIVLHFHMQAQDAFPYFRELCRLRLGPRFGRGALPAICAVPAFAAARGRYLAKRAAQRVKQRGLIGLIPERFELAWTRANRSDRTPAP